MKLPEIQTARTFVTHYACVDARLLHRYFRDNADFFAPWEPLREPDHDDVPRIEERQTASLADFEAGRAVQLVALDPARARVLAVCSFTGIVRGPFQACYLGYSVDEAHQGTGVMFEVVQAGLAYMRDGVGLHRVMANHMPRNVRSARLLARLGFEREGYARAYIQIAGAWEDHVLNALVFDGVSPVPTSRETHRGHS